MCAELATQYDTIREEYWNYINRSLTLKYGEGGATGAAAQSPPGGASNVHTADYIDSLHVPPEPETGAGDAS